LAENTQLKRQGERQQDENLQVSRLRESAQGQSRDLSANLYDLEAKLKNRDEQIAQVRRELEDIRFSNSSLVDRNADVRAEIEALQQHIRVLED